ncbi:MAG: response regulator transcription factor [Phaeodactylibacter sp.]|nr:response regulator transcription factor [Phaeodactylibacter sp.]
MFAPHTFKTIIVDDEPLARQRVLHLLQQRPDFEVVGACRNGREALELLQQEVPDLLFLDIQMKGMNGFDLLEQMDASTTRPLVIFITAFDEYALKAFDVFAFDYLLKPFKDDRFFQSLERAVQQMEQHRPALFWEKLQQLIGHVSEEVAAPAAPPDLIPVRQARKVRLIDPGNIHYVIGAGYYIELHAGGKRFLLRESMQRFLEKLPANQFLRVHRSAIISMDHLESLQQGSGGEWAALMKDGRLIRVSRTYKPELLRRLGLAGED